MLCKWFPICICNWPGVQWKLCHSNTFAAIYWCADFGYRMIQFVRSSAIRGLRHRAHFTFTIFPTTFNKTILNVPLNTFDLTITDENFTKENRLIQFFNFPLYSYYSQPQTNADVFLFLIVWALLFIIGLGVFWCRLSTIDNRQSSTIIIHNFIWHFQCLNEFDNNYLRDLRTFTTKFDLKFDIKQKNTTTRQQTISIKIACPILVSMFNYLIWFHLIWFWS